MRRLLLVVCLLLLAGCSGASTSATSTGSLATGIPTSTASPTPAVSPTPSCSDAVRHHQLGELVTTVGWQITLTSVIRDTKDTTLLDIAFTLQNTTSNVVGLGNLDNPYDSISFALLDSTLSHDVPEVFITANPTTVPAGGTTIINLRAC